MNTPRALLRFGAASLLTTLLAAPGCAVDATESTASTEDVASAAAAVTSSTNKGWGWVWADQVSGTFTPNGSYSFNSKGGTNQVTWGATGNARVDFPNLADAGGNVQVMAYGSGSERCKVQGWGPSGTTLSVWVGCHTASGAPVNTRFVVLYDREIVSGTFQGAYLWADQPTSASYTPSTYYQYNSAGTYATVTRSAAGTYVARLPGQQYVGPSSVQVTAYGSGSERCKVGSWTVSGSDTLVLVMCFGATGAAADTQFTLNYHRDVPVYGNVGGFAWANQPTTASYAPVPNYSLLDNAAYPYYYGPGISIGRSAQGSYFVRYPSMRSYDSVALVTAYGGDASYCKPSGWSASGSDTLVYVACFDASGAPFDTQFTQAYIDDEQHIPG